MLREVATLLAMLHAGTALINNDWETLARYLMNNYTTGGIFFVFNRNVIVNRETTIRYFSPTDYPAPPNNAVGIWNLGSDISCSVSDQTGDTVQVPSSFLSARPIKVETSIDSLI